MTESQINDLRKELIRLTARMASASCALLISVEQGVPREAIAYAAGALRIQLTEWAGWVRRAAGEDDLAKLETGQGEAAK